VRLPDLLIAGAPRSGTTWLYWLLDRHPSVYMAKPVKPEPKFFLVDDLYQRGLEYYARTWFNGAGEAPVAGEKSTDYLESPAVAARIAGDLPGVKLVFILREPVSRAYSNYLWTKMNGLETLDFETAIRLEEQRERELPARLRFARPYSYVSRGMYADMLRPYFERFPRPHILVVRFEDIIDAPARLADRLHRFLGIEPRVGDAEGLGVINPAERPVDGMPDEARRELAARYADPNRELARMLGDEFAIWP
jgi:hypothetical protein